MPQSEFWPQINVVRASYVAEGHQPPQDHRTTPTEPEQGDRLKGVRERGYIPPRCYPSTSPRNPGQLLNTPTNLAFPDQVLSLTHWLVTIIDTDCHLHWCFTITDTYLSLTLAVTDTGCHWHWLSLMMTVSDTDYHWHLLVTDTDIYHRNN